MISAAFNTVVYTPLYNGLIFLVDTMPWHDVGLAVIALTLIVRILLYPLARQALKTQLAMRDMAPEVEVLKEKYKDNREEQARALFALYKEKGVKPFSSFLMLLVQIPLLIGLYWVFWKGGLPSVDANYLYSFIASPEIIRMEFLGIVDMGGRSILLALLAGATQLLYAQISMGPRKERPKEPSFSADLAYNMDLQMRYVLPVLLGFFAYVASAAVALYFVASNLFMVVQDIHTKRAMGRAATD